MSDTGVLPPDDSTNRDVSQITALNEFGRSPSAALASRNSARTSLKAFRGCSAAWRSLSLIQNCLLDGDPIRCQLLMIMDGCALGAPFCCGYLGNIFSFLDGGAEVAFARFAIGPNTSVDHVPLLLWRPFDKGPNVTNNGAFGSPRTVLFRGAHDQGLIAQDGLLGFLKFLSLGEAPLGEEPSGQRVIFAKQWR